MDDKDAIVILSKDTLTKNELSSLDFFLSSKNKWSDFLELLSFHKLLSRVYSHITQNNFNFALPRHVYQILQNQYTLTQYRSSMTNNKTCPIFEEMNESGISYCIIKGYTLMKDVFPHTIREFRDVDVLIHKNEYHLVDEVLQSFGCSQGEYNFKDKKIQKSRCQEIAYLIDTHQVLPYCLLTGDPLFPVIRIDVQFEYNLQKRMNYSIDYDEVIERRIKKTDDEINVFVLDPFDDFLMLCTHLHGEAVIFSEICKGKDLQLSKIADIFQWLQKYAKDYCWDSKVETIMKYNMQIPVAYSMYLVYVVYKIEVSKSILDKLGIVDYSFVDYYYNEHNELTRWDKPVLERMFCTTRPLKQRN